MVAEDGKESTKEVHAEEACSIIGKAENRKVDYLELVNDESKQVKPNALVEPDCAAAAPYTHYQVRAAFRDHTSSEVQW